ncbi:MAG: DUF368 domain-containing protein [Oscillospiraceae bacterium]|jgi:putative membrane protein|nr:DUF368 domain-containing protein [Oscillospiraceae bacterium]
MKKLFKLLTSIFNGAVFGAVNVIPGVSSGTMLVIFSCYDIVCGALALDFRHIKKHLVFLIPFAFGAAAGLGGAVFAAAFLLERHPVPTFLFFIGLITGSLPLIFKNLHLKGKPKTPHMVLAGVAMALVVLLSLMGEPEAAETAYQAGTLFIAQIIISGFVAAAAMLIPGISGAFMLMLLGVYHTITKALTELDFYVIVPACIGIAAGVVLGARGIKFLLSRFYTATYSIISGLVIGSLFAIFPEGVKPDLSLVTGICAFVFGATVTLAAGRANRY